MTDLPNFAALEPDALREAAREIVQPRNPRRHWTQLAALIGTVTDRGVWQEWTDRETGEPFRSVRVWADRDLGLDADDVWLHLRLWRAIIASGQPLETWAGISKGKARVVLRALHLGGDAQQWLLRALAADSEEDLRQALAKETGREVWVERTIQMPQEVAEIFDQAMLRALAEIASEEGIEVPADVAAQQALVERREIGFRCLEQIVGSYLA